MTIPPCRFEIPGTAAPREALEPWQVEGENPGAQRDTGAESLILGENSWVCKPHSHPSAAMHHERQP